MWLRLGGGSGGVPTRTRPGTCSSVFPSVPAEGGPVLADASHGSQAGGLGGVVLAWLSVFFKDAYGPSQGEMSFGRQDLLLGGGESVVDVSVLTFLGVGGW